jgi:GLPGLI family protein
MKNFFLLLMFTFLLFGKSDAQKKVAELSLQFEGGLLDKDGNWPQASKVQLNVFIKGFLSRSEQLASGFTSTTLHDTHTGATTLLKEVSGQKLMIRLSEEEWAQKNVRFKDISFQYTGKSKTIAGYSCDVAEAELPGGMKLKVYFTQELDLENKSFEPMFSSLAGLPLEWELSQGTNTLKYTLVKIELNPIPISKFDLPKSGYRELSYEEAKKQKMN